MRDIMFHGPNATGMYDEFRMFLPENTTRQEIVTLDYGSEEEGTANGHARRSPSETAAAVNNNGFPVEFVLLRNEIIKGIEHFQEAIQGQYYSADEEAESFKKWINPSVLIKNFVGLDSEPEYENLTFWVSASLPVLLNFVECEFRIHQTCSRDDST